jgi:DNA-binding MarR family transcriptional regulator
MQPGVGIGRRRPEDIDLGEIPLHVGSYLRMFGQAHNAMVDETMQDNPIGPGMGKTSTLQIIGRNPGISQIEISEIFGRDRSAQLRIVSELERRGLVYRRIDPNERRRQMLFLTAEGESLVEGVDALTRKNEKAMFSALTPEEYAELRRLLRIVWIDHLGDVGRIWDDD